MADNERETTMMARIPREGDPDTVTTVDAWGRKATRYVEADVFRENSRSTPLIAKKVSD